MKNYAIFVDEGRRGVWITLNKELMMRQNLFKMVLLVVLVGYCGVSVASDERKELRLLKKLEKELVSAKLKLNQIELKTYLDWLGITEDVPAVYSIQKLPEKFVERYPELRVLREEFEEKDKVLLDVLMKESDYAANMSPKEKSAIYRRLAATSAAYRVARQERTEALRRSNVMTLMYLRDWCKENKYVLPLSFLRQDAAYKKTLENPKLEVLRQRVEYLEREVNNLASGKKKRWEW